jgi:hypothetical protein
MNMGDAVPKIIKIGPWERGQTTDSWHRWYKTFFVAMVTIVTVFSVRRHLRMTKQMSINRPKQMSINIPKQMSINRPKQLSIECEILSHWLKYPTDVVFPKLQNVCW